MNTRVSLYQARYGSPEVTVPSAGSALIDQLLAHRSVRARMPAGVPDADQSPFVALILEEFRTLHAGNAVRFGLRPLEFDAWQQGQARVIRR